MSPLLKLAVGLLTLVAASLSFSASSVTAGDAKSAGTAKDDAYAAKVWSYMATNGLIGEGRVRSFPFVGSRPHGSIQEFIATQAVIDGQRGRLLIKHNYGAEEALTPKSVYAGGPDINYEPLAIMFQREEGYDPENNDWFWAEYNPDGTVFNYQGANLSGRAPLCISCHMSLGGEDREILNGSAK